MFNSGSVSYDKSKLFKAWKTHYLKMGLSYSKMQKLIEKKCRKNQAPIGMNINDLVKLTPNCC